MPPVTSVCCSRTTRVGEKFRPNSRCALQKMQSARAKTALPIQASHDLNERSAPRRSVVVAAMTGMMARPQVDAATRKCSRQPNSDLATATLRPFHSRGKRIAPNTISAARNRYLATDGVMRTLVRRSAAGNPRRGGDICNDAPVKVGHRRHRDMIDARPLRHVDVLHLAAETVVCFDRGADAGGEVIVLQLPHIAGRLPCGNRVKR